VAAVVRSLDVEYCERMRIVTEVLGDLVDIVDLEMDIHIDQELVDTQTESVLIDIVLEDILVQ
jgi:hypothetical protein